MKTTERKPYQFSERKPKFQETCNEQGDRRILELNHVASYIAYKIKVWDNKNNKPKTLHCTQLNIPIVEDDRYTLMLYPLSQVLNSKSLLDQADDFCIEMIELNKPELLPYGYAQILLKNHVDLFGLIEKGLAINMLNFC